MVGEEDAGNALAEACMDSWQEVKRAQNPPRRRMIGRCGAVLETLNGGSGTGAHAAIGPPARRQLHCQES